MKIRKAVFEDLDFIKQGLLETHIIEKWPEENLVPVEEVEDAKNSIQKEEIFIVDLDGQNVGFVWIEPEFRAMHLERDDYLWVHLIFVSSKFREKGVGKFLHENVERIAKQFGKEEIMLDIFKVNEASQAFYSKLGFSPVYTIYSKKI